MGRTTTIATSYIDDEGGQADLRICCKFLVSSDFHMVWLINDVARCDVYKPNVVIYTSAV